MPKVVRRPLLVVLGIVALAGIGVALLGVGVVFVTILISDLL